MVPTSASWNRIPATLHLLNLALVGLTILWACADQTVIYPINRVVQRAVIALLTADEGVAVAAVILPSLGVCPLGRSV